MDPKELGSKIQSLRKKAKLSQEALASKAGVAHRAVQQIEGGYGNPTLGTIMALCKTLDFDPFNSKPRTLKDLPETIGEMTPEDFKLWQEETLKGFIKTEAAAVTPAMHEAVLTELYEARARISDLEKLLASRDKEEPRLPPALVQFLSERTSSELRGILLDLRGRWTKTRKSQRKPV